MRFQIKTTFIKFVALVMKNQEYIKELFIVKKYIILIMLIYHYYAAIKFSYWSLIFKKGNSGIPCLAIWRSLIYPTRTKKLRNEGA
jgi:hypothetical protein